MKQKTILTIISLYTVLAALVAASPVSAHDQPAGNDWIMADWMLWSFLIFFGAALVVFLVAAKRGMFSNLEESKYYILTINEPDYYTPDWARDEEDPGEASKAEEDGTDLTPSEPGWALDQIEEVQDASRGR